MNLKLEKAATLEAAATTRNGIQRMIFSLIAILMELVLVFFSAD